MMEYMHGDLNKAIFDYVKTYLFLKTFKMKKKMLMKDLY